MARATWSAFMAAAFLTACSSELVPHSTLSESRTQAPSVSRAFDPSISDPATTIFVSYDGTAPADRVIRAREPGVRFVFNNQLRQRLAIDVADSALARVISSLRNLGWVKSVVVAPHPHFERIAASRRRTLEPLAANRRMADVVPWGVHFTNADRVQSVFSNTGSGVKVGVMDTGIYCSNSDFGSVHGVDEVHDGVYGFCDDVNGHGTGVAGIIGAIANGTEVLGMAPAVSLWSIRVINTAGLITTYGPVEAGLVDARDSGVQVLNMSFADCGFPKDTLPSALKDDIADDSAAGMIMVAAAGNGSHGGCAATDPVSTFATLGGVIAVAAVQADSVSPSGFQRGSQIWVAAPTNVETDSAAGLRVANLTGTSAAAPHVAGAAALLIYQGKTAGEVKTILSYETQTKPGTGLLARNDTVGYGTLDAAAAVQLTPQIWAFTITSACDPHANHGSTCTLRPTLGLSGYSPVTYTWSHTEDSPGTISVSESDSVFTFTATGDTSITFSVHIKAWPHDTVTARHPRVGLESDYNVLVCHGGGGEQMVAPPKLGLPLPSRAQGTDRGLRASLPVSAFPGQQRPAPQLPRAMMPPPPQTCG